MRKNPHRLAILFALLAALFSADFPVNEARAADCAQIAGQVAANRNGELISVKSRQNGGVTRCVVTLRIPGRDGRPPRIIKVVREGN